MSQPGRALIRVGWPVLTCSAMPPISTLLIALAALQATPQASPSTRPAQSTTPGQAQPQAQPQAQTQPAVPETIRVATWNIENWNDHFEANRLRSTTAPALEEDVELREGERYQNDEDNWEISQVILDPAFSPDILVFQEGCSQDDLDYFNERWLQDAYETAIIFPGNSTRVQTLGILIKPGFTIVENADQYFQEPDPNDLNPGSDLLFARGPAFVLIEAPGGYRFWVGTTHQKSKSGNSVEATQWRAGEAAATHAIMQELRNQGPLDVILLGDMNDEAGIQEFEAEAGGDVMATLVGPPAAGLLLATKDLADQGAISFTGYWNPRYRSFIDHIVMTQETADQVRTVGVYDTPWARVASDHLPVYVDIVPDPAGKDERRQGDVPGPEDMDFSK